MCEYRQVGIESGEIRSCVTIGEKEIPLPIPQDNFYILKFCYEIAKAKSKSP